MDIVFLGMGLMGSRMAKRLVDAHFNVRIWNRSAQVYSQLPFNAPILESFGAINTASIIALCLSDDDAVTEIATKLMPHLRSGQIIVDFSSLSVHTTQHLCSLAEIRGALWIDAPVSGGTVGAEHGNLVVFAGGDKTAISQLSAFFTPLAQRVNYMGASGAGQITKICNQLIVASTSCIIAEAVALASKAGIDATQLAPALANGFADSKPLQILAPRMASGTFTPLQWRVKTLSKDLYNAQQLAHTHQLSLPISQHAWTLLQSCCDNGLDNNDLASIIYHYLPPASYCR